jgi:hypothetical protein
LGLARSAVTHPGVWDGLVCAEDWAYLASSLSEDRLRDLHGVLLECSAGLRREVVTEIRRVAVLGDRAVVHALARITDRLESRDARVLP